MFMNENNDVDMMLYVTMQTCMLTRIKEFEEKVTALLIMGTLTLSIAVLSWLNDKNNEVKCER